MRSTHILVGKSSKTSSTKKGTRLKEDPQIIGATDGISLKLFVSFFLVRLDFIKRISYYPRNSCAINKDSIFYDFKARRKLKTLEVDLTVGEFHCFEVVKWTHEPKG